MLTSQSLEPGNMLPYIQKELYRGSWVAQSIKHLTLKHKRLLKTENKLRVDGGVGGRGGWVTGIEEGIFWDEHWVLYGNQFDNKFQNKNK